MHDSKHNSTNGDGGTGFDPELSFFGFDDPGDQWLERFGDAMASVELQPASLGKLGQFEILHEVSRGGQGVVYRARQPGMKRDVAIKRMIAGSLATESMRRRFVREIEIASTLSHPNIASVFAVESVNGHPILAMEWIDGLAITEWAAGRDAKEIMAMFLRVCDAVQHAHLRGVIHRDLKPSNILVDVINEPHVLDFGLAKISDVDAGQETITEGFAGTPAYASPEQVGGANQPADIDVRTDVYSLGVILFRMLAGCMPYEATESGGALVDTLAAIRDVDPAKPSSMNCNLDDETDAIVLKALAKPREERYQSAAALGEDLSRYLAGQPVQAHPRSRSYLLRKYFRRHRMAFGFLTVAALILISLGIALMISAQRAIRAQKKETEARQTAEQITAFLQETLSLAGPAGKGRDVTVLQLLDEAALQADAKLADRPQVAAEVFLTIGMTHANLWRWGESIPFLKKAVELSRQAHGSDCEVTARAIVALGRSLSNMSDPQAITLQQEALAIRTRLYGDQDPLTAESKMRLGYALFRSVRPPRFEEAELQLRDALDTYRAELGPRHRDIASCLHNYGYMRLVQGQRIEAEQLYHEALTMLEALNAQHDPFYVECLHGYTSLLNSLGRYEDCIARLQVAIPLVERMYGESQIAPLEARYGRAALMLGDVAVAHTMFRGYTLHTLMGMGERNPEHAATMRTMMSMIDDAAASNPDSIPASQLADAAANLPEPLKAEVNRCVKLRVASMRDREPGE